MDEPDASRPGTGRMRSPTTRNILLACGIVLIALTPVVGPIPGPGGVIVFAAGLTLVLKNSHSAKRRFVRVKRRWPRLGDLADRGLRRASARRRRERTPPGETPR